MAFSLHFEAPLTYYLTAGVALAIFLALAAVPVRSVSRGTAFEVAFILSLYAALFACRWPVFFLPHQMNPDEGAQDWADAQDLYRILESEVVPRYYQRDRAGVPRGWTEMMRNSISSTIWRFSTTRMLHEYTEQLYLPAAGVAGTASGADNGRSRRETIVTEAG
jgi:hypothetical protein